MAPDTEKMDSIQHLPQMNNFRNVGNVSNINKARPDLYEIQNSSILIQIERIER